MQVATAAGFAASLLCSAAAMAQDKLVLRAGYALTWDDNPFRLPDAATPPSVEGQSERSDRYSTATIGLGVNIPYSLQRFAFDLTRGAVRYEKFSSLDSDPFSYRGAWLWQLTPRVSGSLSAARSESRVKLEDVAGNRNVQQRTTEVRGTADAAIGGGWHLLGAIWETDLKNSEPFLAQPDTRETRAELGLRYIFGSGTEFTLTRRQSQGNESVLEPALLGGSDFTQDETELSVAWLVTARSTLRGRLTYVDRRHELRPQRDFSGTGGDIAYLWRPTGKLQVNLSASRKLEPYNLEIGSTLRVEDTVTAAVLWQVAERIGARTGLFRRESRYGQLSTSTTPVRRDDADGMDLAITWSPRRYVTLSATLTHAERSSTDPAQSFDANVASAGVAFAF